MLQIKWYHPLPYFPGLYLLFKLDLPFIWFIMLKCCYYYVWLTLWCLQGWKKAHCSAIDKICSTYFSLKVPLESALKIVFGTSKGIVSSCDILDCLIYCGCKGYLLHFYFPPSQIGHSFLGWNYFKIWFKLLM